MATKQPKSPSRKSKPAPRTSEGTVDAAAAPLESSFPVVGIGASAGGLEAVKQLLRGLPPDTGMAFVLVQHLDPTHPSMLTEILSRATAMPVTEVTASMGVEPNHVYVIPPGADLICSGGDLLPSKRTEPRGLRRPIDLFLRSLAEDRGHKAIGVILSGSATDGTLGCEEIKAAGGITFAQDDSAQHDSMPRSAAAAGCVDLVLSPAEIARELARIARHPYVDPEAQEKAELVLPRFNFGAILELLKDSQGVDFSHYKRNTLYRRVTRRMLLHKLDDLKDYVSLLGRNPAEVEALYHDILINVTSFFRNPESYELLKKEVFPGLVEGRSRNDPLRFWALGCSTGEEAYSLAIALSEFMDETGRPFPVQIFATDLNGAGIERARAGVYSRNIVQDLSPERLRRHFVESDGGYRVRPAIREACVFARHNVLTEPPFSRIDFASCRNLLIYLGQEMQQRVIPIIHYALRPQGFLWLGNSETIGTYRDLFDLVDARHKVYRKKPAPARAQLGPIVQGYRRDPQGDGQHFLAREGPIPGVDTQKEAERILLAKYAPASVLVNAEHEILQFRGNTGHYLTPAPGRASLNLLKMLREGLLLAVRAALHKAAKDGAPVRNEGLRVKTNGGSHDVSVEVIPVKGNSAAPPCFLVLFENAPGAGAAAPEGKEEQTAAALERPSTEHEGLRMAQELAATREYLQSVIEQQESVNEELQSANEEVQSANEELQSINEELETSKEEVQASNEELATVNEELSQRNLELAQSNNDLLNLLSSVQMAIVIVGADLRIRRFTPAAEKMLNLIPADVGRPIRDLNLNVSIPDFEHRLEEVIDTVRPREFEILDRHGRWHALRLRPYRTADNKIDGVVLILVDIDTVKRNVEMLNRQVQMMDQAHEPMLIWEQGGTIAYWNKTAETVYGYTQDEAVGRQRQELLSAPREKQVDEALEQHGWWTGNLSYSRSDASQIEVCSRMVLVREADGRNFVIEAHRLVDGEGGG